MVPYVSHWGVGGSGERSEREVKCQYDIILTEPEPSYAVHTVLNIST